MNESVHRRDPVVVAGTFTVVVPLHVTTVGFAPDHRDGFDESEHDVAFVEASVSTTAPPLEETLLEPSVSVAVGNDGASSVSVCVAVATAPDDPVAVNVNVHWRRLVVVGNVAVYVPEQSTDAGLPPVHSAGLDASEHVDAFVEE